MTIAEKAAQIIADIQEEKGNNPAQIFKHMASRDYIDIHGPEHHILDGACILVAYHNAGGNISFPACLDQLAEEGLRMPGAMCGLWGVCGAVSSVGAALAIIDKTGPLSEDGSWGRHMELTSAALHDLGKINGPRCCKRDAMIAFRNAVTYINSNYNVTLEYEDLKCEFSSLNKQCIGNRCPFHS